MSRHSRRYLANNILRGFTDKRGNAWWGMGNDPSILVDDNGESNHFAGAIPVDDVMRRLFHWSAVPRALYVDTPAGMVKLPDVAWCRDDTYSVMGIHGEGYHGHQYGEWLIKAVAPLIGHTVDSVAIANAGLLADGAVAYVQMEIPESVNTPEGVTIRPFLMATTSFDGSIATTFKTGYTDTVCDNTRELFLREAGEVVKIRHSRNSALRITDAAGALNTLHLVKERAEKEIATLAAIPVTDSVWSQFVTAHVPIDDDATGRARTMPENKREALTQLYRTDMRVAPWAGTAWGVVQAVNTWAHHVQTVKGKTADGGDLPVYDRNMMRAVKGEWSGIDQTAITDLSRVMGRDLIGAGAK